MTLLLRLAATGLFIAAVLVSGHALVPIGLACLAASFLPPDLGSRRAAQDQ